MAAVNPSHPYLKTVQTSAGISFALITAVAVAVLSMQTGTITVGAWITGEGLIPMSALGAAGLVSFTLFIVSAIAGRGGGAALPQRHEQSSAVVPKAKPQIPAPAQSPMISGLVETFQNLLVAGIRKWGVDSGSSTEGQIAALDRGLETLVPMMAKLMDNPNALLERLKKTQLLRKWITAMNCGDVEHMERYAKLARGEEIEQVHLTPAHILKQILTVMGLKLFLFHKLMQPQSDRKALYREFDMEFLTSECIEVVGDKNPALWLKQLELRERKIEVAFVKTKDTKHPLVAFALEVYKEKRGIDADLNALQLHLPQELQAEYLAVPCTLSDHPLKSLKEYQGTIQGVAGWTPRAILKMAVHKVLVSSIPGGFSDLGLAEAEDPALVAMGNDLSTALTDIIIDGYLKSGPFHQTFEKIVADDFPAINTAIVKLVSKQNDVEGLLKGFKQIIDALAQKLVRQ